MTDVRWLAYRDRFPFDVGEELGSLSAPDRATALQCATALYGGPVVVRSLLAVEAAKREVQVIDKRSTPKHGPARQRQLERARYARAEKARQHRAQKEQQHQQRSCAPPERGAAMERMEHVTDPRTNPDLAAAPVPQEERACG